MIICIHSKQNVFDKSHHLAQFPPEIHLFPICHDRPSPLPGIGPAIAPLILAFSMHIVGIKVTLAKTDHGGIGCFCRNLLARNLRMFCF